MDNASWIYADLIGLGVAIACILVFVAFVDDLLERFAWTKGSGYWTKAQLTLSSTGFRAGSRCKTTISASAQALTVRLSELDSFRDRFFFRRTGKSALTYELVAGVSRSQAAYDLAELVDAGILDRVGNGRATRYRLAREGGAQRHWTNDRIRAELEAFCADSTTWPSAAEFKNAGRGDLYVAASRYGGIAHWTEVLGFARSERRATAVPRTSPLRTKLKWAGAGAVAAPGLAAAAGAVFVSLDRHVTSRATPALSERVTDESLHPLIPQARHARTPLARRVHRQPTHAASARRSRPRAASASSTSAPVQTSATSGVAGVRTVSYSTPATPSGPAPLPAPSGGSAPPPLKAP